VGFGQKLKMNKKINFVRAKPFLAFESDNIGKIQKWKE